MGDTDSAYRGRHQLSSSHHPGRSQRRELERYGWNLWACGRIRISTRRGYVCALRSERRVADRKGGNHRDVYAARNNSYENFARARVGHSFGTITIGETFWSEILWPFGLHRNFTVVRSRPQIVGYTSNESNVARPVFTGDQASAAHHPRCDPGSHRRTIVEER